MKTLITILGIFTALSAQAGLEKSGSYDSYRIEASGRPITVVLSLEVESCGLTGMSGEMRPVPSAAEQTVLLDFSAYSTYQACNPFVPRKKELVKSEPLTIPPAEGSEYVKLIVPAGYQLELLP